MRVNYPVKTTLVTVNTEAVTRTMYRKYGGGYIEKSSLGVKGVRDPKLVNSPDRRNHRTVRPSAAAFV
jgi:hypothetical protein